MRHRRSLPSERVFVARNVALSPEFGLLPFVDFLAMIRTDDSLSDEQIKLVCDGMQTLVGMLRFVRGEDDQSEVQ
jgi:hypothetical protein